MGQRTRPHPRAGFLMPRATVGKSTTPARVVATSNATPAALQSLAQPHPQVIDNMISPFFERSVAVLIVARRIYALIRSGSDRTADAVEVTYQTTACVERQGRCRAISHTECRRVTARVDSGRSRAGCAGLRVFMRWRYRMPATAALGLSQMPPRSLISTFENASTRTSESSCLSGRVLPCRSSVSVPSRGSCRRVGCG
jgi:hypothetical protein